MNRDVVPVITNVYSLVDNQAVGGGVLTIPDSSSHLPTSLSTVVSDEVKLQDPFKSIPDYVINSLAEYTKNEQKPSKYVKIPQSYIYSTDAAESKFSTASTKRVIILPNKTLSTSTPRVILPHTTSHTSSSTCVTPASLKHHVLTSSNSTLSQSNSPKISHLEIQKPESTTSMNYLKNCVYNIQKHSMPTNSEEKQMDNIVSSTVVDNSLEDIQEDEAKLIAESLFISPLNTSASEAEPTPQKKKIENFIYANGVPDESSLPVIVSDIKNESDKEDDDDDDIQITKSTRSPTIKIKIPTKRDRKKDLRRKTKQTVIEDILSSDDDGDDAGAYDDDDSEYNPDEDESTSSADESDSDQMNRSTTTKTQALLMNKASLSGCSSIPQVKHDNVSVDLVFTKNNYTAPQTDTLNNQITSSVKQQQKQPLSSNTNQAINILNKKKSEIENSIKQMIAQQKAKDQLARLVEESNQRRNRRVVRVDSKEGELKLKQSIENVKCTTPAVLVNGTVLKDIKCKKCFQKVSKMEDLVKHICPVLANELKLKSKKAKAGAEILQKMAETVISEDKISKARQIAKKIPIDRSNSHDNNDVIEVFSKAPCSVANVVTSASSVGSVNSSSTRTATTTAAPPATTKPPVPMYFIAPPNSSASQVVFFPKTPSTRAAKQLSHGPGSSTQQSPGQKLQQTNAMYIPVTVFKKSHLQMNHSMSPSSVVGLKPVAATVGVSPGTVKGTTAMTSVSHIMNYGTHFDVRPQISHAVPSSPGGDPLLVRPVVTSNVGSLIGLKPGTSTTTGVRPGTHDVMYPMSRPAVTGAVRVFPYTPAGMRPITLPIGARSHPIQPTTPIQIRYTTPVNIRPATTSAVSEVILNQQQQHHHHQQQQQATKLQIPMLHNSSLKQPIMQYQQSVVKVTLPCTSTTGGQPPVQYVRIGNVAIPVSVVSSLPTLSHLVGSSSGGGTAVTTARSVVVSCTAVSSSPSAASGVKPPLLQFIGGGKVSAVNSSPIYVLPGATTATTSSAPLVTSTQAPPTTTSTQPTSISKRTNILTPSMTKSIEIIDLSTDPVSASLPSFVVSERNTNVNTNINVLTNSTSTTSSSDWDPFNFYSTYRTIAPATVLGEQSPRAILSTISNLKGTTLLSSVNSFQTIPSASTTLVKTLSLPRLVTLSDAIKKKYGMSSSAPAPQLIQVTPRFTKVESSNYINPDFKAPATPQTLSINLIGKSGVVTTTTLTTFIPITALPFRTSNQTTMSTTSSFPFRIGHQTMTTSTQELQHSTTTTTATTTPTTVNVIQTVSGSVAPASVFNENNTPNSNPVSKSGDDGSVMTTSVADSNNKDTSKNVIMQPAVLKPILMNAPALRPSIISNPSTLAINPHNSKTFPNFINRFATVPNAKNRFMLNSDKILIPSNQIIKVNNRQNYYYVLPKVGVSGTSGGGVKVAAPFNIAGEKMPVSLVAPTSTATKRPIHIGSMPGLHAPINVQNLPTTKVQSSPTNVLPSTSFKESISIDCLPTTTSINYGTYPTPNITLELLKVVGVDDNILIEDISSTVSISKNSPMTKAIVSSAIISTISKTTTTETYLSSTIAKEPSVPIQLGLTEKLFRMAKTKRKAPTFMANRYDSKFACSLGFEMCLEELQNDYYNIEKGAQSISLSASDYLSAFWVKKRIKPKEQTSSTAVTTTTTTDKIASSSGDNLIIDSPQPPPDKTQTVRTKKTAKISMMSTISTTTTKSDSNPSVATGISDTLTIIEHLRKSGNDISKTISGYNSVPSKVLSPPSQLSSGVLDRILSKPPNISSTSTSVISNSVTSISPSSISIDVSQTQSLNSIMVSPPLICKSEDLHDGAASHLTETATAAEQLESILKETDDISGSLVTSDALRNSLLSVAKENLLRKRKNSLTTVRLECEISGGNKKQRNDVLNDRYNSVVDQSLSKEGNRNESRLRTRIKSKKESILIDDDDNEAKDGKVININKSEDEIRRNIFDILDAVCSSSRETNESKIESEKNHSIESVTIKAEPEDDDDNWVSSNTELTSYVDDSIEDSKSELKIDIHSGEASFPVDAERNKFVTSEKEPYDSHDRDLSRQPVGDDIENMDSTLSASSPGSSKNDDDDNNSVENDLMIVDDDTDDSDDEDSDSDDSIDIGFLTLSQLNPGVVIEKLDVSKYCLP